MTAHEMLNKALRRLGYTDSNGNNQLHRRIMQKALDIIEDVYYELWQIAKPAEEFKSINTLSDTLNLPENALCVMVYGVAAFIAISENDDANKNWWLQVYNRKRATLSSLTNKKDVVPKVYGG